LADRKTLSGNMKINLSRLYANKKRRLFVVLIAGNLIADIATAFWLISSHPTSDNSALLRSIQHQIEAESRQMQGVTSEIIKLKKDYETLNKKLSQELSFKEGLKFVLAAEGGLSNNLEDKGGLTNLGITHDEYAQYRSEKGLPPRSVAQISLAEARDIYKHTYWLNSGCSDTPRDIAIACFDWQVNSGRGFSTLQQTLGVAPDSIPGHETFNELGWWLSKHKEDKLLHNYFQIRDGDYRRWGVGSQAVFLSGWLRRSQELKEYLHVH